VKRKKRREGLYVVYNDKSSKCSGGAVYVAPVGLFVYVLR